MDDNDYIFAPEKAMIELIDKKISK